MTQKEAVLEYLEEHGSITPFEAFEKLFVTRLGGQIYFLRKDGHKIRREDVTKKNIYGTTATFARYILEDEE